MPNLSLPRWPNLLIWGGFERFNLAYVGTEPLFDHDRFGQTVATNRGAHIKSVENVDDALSWLDAAPA